MFWNYQAPEYEYELVDDMTEKSCGHRYTTLQCKMDVGWTMTCMKNSGGHRYTTHAHAVDSNVRFHRIYGT